MTAQGHYESKGGRVETLIGHVTVFSELSM